MYNVYGYRNTGTKGRKDTGIHGNMDTEITLQVYMDKDLKRINVS